MSQRICSLILLELLLVLCLQNVAKSTEIPFCAGRSKSIAISSVSRLLLDGSNYKLYEYISAAAEPQTGTTCKCSLTPGDFVQTMTVKLKSSLQVDYCTKNLVIDLPSSYYFDTSDCTSQTFTLDRVGTRTVDISLRLFNIDHSVRPVNDSYEVSIETTAEALSTEFRVTCFAPYISVSSTTNKPTTSATLNVTSSTTSSTSTSSVGTTAGPTLATTTEQNNSDSSKTVLIVCLIVASGILLMSITIFILCCIARRMNKKTEEKHLQSPGGKIYRRIYNTIRTIPRTLNLRRPLPAPPESSVKATKIRTRVSAVDSGPYDSISSSVKSTETSLTGSRAPKPPNGHIDSHNDYGYIYPIHDKAKPEKKISPLAIEDMDKYLTPILDRKNNNETRPDDTCSQDSEYVNTQSAVESGNDPVNITQENNKGVDGVDESSAPYMEMWNAVRGQSKHSATSNNAVKIETKASSTPTELHKDKVLQREPTQDVYMEMDNISATETESISDKTVTVDNPNSIQNDSDLQNDTGIDSATPIKCVTKQDTYVDMHNTSNETEDNTIVEAGVNNYINPLNRQSTQEKYMTMDNSTNKHDKINPSITNKTLPVDAAENTVHSNESRTDSGYMTMKEIDTEKSEDCEHLEHDKTFPDLMKFHVASVKPKLHRTKKPPPPVKPKPVKYVRGNPVDDMESKI